MGLKFQSKDCAVRAKYVGLFEHLLVHTVAFAGTFNSEQYTVLEKYMYEAILGTECYSAIFSCNLWILLIRINDQLVLATLQSLIRIYQKLEKHNFNNSPQEVHLKYTIRKFFEVLLPESKILIGKQLSPQNSLWCAANVRDLPDHLRRNIEAVILENMKMCLHECFQSSNVSAEKMDNLIQIMKMATTCSFSENTAAIEQLVVRLWSKACNKNECIQSNEFCTTDTLWHFKYLETLVAMTEGIGVGFLNSTNLGRVLHCISTIMENCNTEIIILLFDLFCLLTSCQREDENQRVIDSIFKHTLNFLLQGVEASIKPYLLNILSKYREHELFDKFTSKFLNEDDIRTEWKLNCDIRHRCNSIEWQQRLLQPAQDVFIHKCMGTKCDISRETQKSIKSIKSEFDLGDFVTQFEEPLAKKRKLHVEELDNIVAKLENNTLLLSQLEDVTLSDEYKKRITDVIIKLKNIVS